MLPKVQIRAAPEAHWLSFSQVRASLGASIHAHARRDRHLGGARYLHRIRDLAGDDLRAGSRHAFHRSLKYQALSFARDSGLPPEHPG